ACTAKGACAVAKAANGIHASASVSDAAVAAKRINAEASATEGRAAPDAKHADTAFSIPSRATQSRNTNPAKPGVTIPAKRKHPIPALTVIADNEDGLARTCQRERHRNTQRTRCGAVAVERGVVQDRSPAARLNRSGDCQL